ncbi:MAG: hypothetical protein LBO66_13950 [Deltaproteobacteria bacterium]|jgi:hypothetical protein|nr:hypothetical protein [Deltaproteobacteria bacterium]
MPKIPKTIASFAVLALSAVMLFATSCGHDPEKDWESLRLLLNHALAGESNWSAASHQTVSGALEVSDLTLNFNDAILQVFPEFKSGNFILSPVKIKTLRVANIASPDDMAKLIASAKWEGAALKLASSLELEGVSYSQTEDDVTLSFLLARSATRDIALAKSAPNDLQGFASFLKGLTIGESKQDGMELRVKAGDGGDNFDGSLAIKSSSLAKLAFPGELKPGAELLDALMLRSLAATDVTGLALNFRAEDGSAVALEIASVKSQNLDGLARVGSSEVQGVSIKGSFPREEIKSFEASLASASLKGFDGTYIVELLQTAYLKTKTADSLPDFEELYNLALIFSYPYGLDSWEAQELVVDIGDLLKFGFESANLQGPIKPLALSNAKSELKGAFLDINPTGPDFWEAKDIREFAKVWGQNSFRGDISYAVKHDPAAGESTYTLDNISVDDNFAASATIKLENLTQELVDALSRVSPKEIEAVLFLPQTLKLGLKEVTINYADHSMIPNIFRIVHELDERDISIPELRARTVDEILNGLAQIYSQDFRSPSQPFEPLRPLLSDFLANPQTITVSILPVPTLSGQNSMSLIGDEKAFFNSLNLTFTANGSQPVTARAQ